MINLYNQVPSVYVSASRDFQYLSWLFNIVLNSVKHNVDDIYKLPNTGSNPKLTELLAMTLGFRVKRNYDEKQLLALVAILPKVLKYKGTEKAILMAAKALVKATGSLGEASVEIDGTEVIVTLPKDLIDVTLFIDLLDYILPAGMTCHVVRKNKTTKDVDDVLIKYADEIKVIEADDLVWHEYGDTDIENTELACLYDLTAAMQQAAVQQNPPDFTSNTKLINNSLVLNAGLLSNVVIPTLEGSELAKSTTAADEGIVETLEDVLASSDETPAQDL